MVGNRKSRIYDPIGSRDRLEDEETELLRKRGLSEHEEIKTVWRLEKYKAEYVDEVSAIMYVALVGELLILKTGWLSGFAGVDMIAWMIQALAAGLSVMIIWNGYKYVESAMDSSQLILFSHEAILGGYKSRKYDRRRSFVYAVVIALSLMNGFYEVTALYLLSILWLRLSEKLLRYRIGEKINHIRKDSVNHGLEC